MSDEHYGFVFALTFIIVFATLLSTIPVGLQGAGETGDMIIPVDPGIISGFSDTANYTKSAFTGNPVLTYAYELGGREWLCQSMIPVIGFTLGAKILYGGFLWLGTMDTCKFVSPQGIDREHNLSFEEIEADAEDGVVRYSLIYYANGASAGGFVVYWNTTTYGNDSSDAWDNDELYLVHGVGFAETATGDIGALIVRLLLLQLPEVPLLVNILLITPIWASIIFVLWFIIKEMIPFV